MGVLQATFYVVHGGSDMSEFSLVDVRVWVCYKPHLMWFTRVAT